MKTTVKSQSRPPEGHDPPGLCLDPRLTVFPPFPMTLPAAKEGTLM